MCVPHTRMVLVAEIIEEAELQRGCFALIGDRQPAVERGPVVTLDEDVSTLSSGWQGKIAVNTPDHIPHGPAAQRQESPDLVPSIASTEEGAEAEAAVGGVPPLALDPRETHVLPQPAVQG